MTTTAQLVQEALEVRGFKQKRNGEWVGNNPFNPSSDSKSFNVRFEGDEWGCFHYFAGSGEMQKGSLYELARKLGIEPVYHVNGSTPQARYEFENLADYASKFGIGAYEAFQQAGWTDVVHANKRAIHIPVPNQRDGIAQIRYLEAAKSKYTWERNGAKGQVFYGLNRAVRQAKDGFIVLCNGAPSVVIADMWGVPAFAQVGGEGALENENLKELIALLDKQKLVCAIVLDCDTKGRESANKIKEQLGDRAVVITLEMHAKEDLGDFARLWGNDTYNELKRLYCRIMKQKPPSTAHQASTYVTALVSGEFTTEGRYLPFPFTKLHQFGGGFKWMQPNLLTGFVAPSGGGKTSAMESGVEYLLNTPVADGRQPYGVLWDGREFSPERYHIRRVQRYLDQIYNAGKPNQFVAPKINSDDILDWIVWQNEAQSGVPEHARLGKCPNADDIKWLNWVNDRIEKWNGYLEYMPQFKYMEQTLEYMRDKTIALRKRGQSVDLWVIDHLNLARLTDETMRSSQENAYNQAAEIIKDAARLSKVHCWLGVQVNKAGSHDMKQRNKRLAAKDLHFVNEMHFNSILAINTLYEESLLWDEDLQSWYKHLDCNGDTVIDIARCEDGSEQCVFEVLKNSFGRNGMVNLKGDLRHLRFLDVEWTGMDKRYSAD